MKRAHFEHVIRAAAAIARDDEIVVIGSQAILAEHPDASDVLLVSRELDVYPKNHPERAIDIDGALGDGSPFDTTYGYFAHGVGPETVPGPLGWENRLVRVEIPNVPRGTVTAWCMSTHDLVLAKISRGQPHDLDFVENAIRLKLVDVRQLRVGVELMPRQDVERTRARLERVLGEIGIE